MGRYKYFLSYQHNHDDCYEGINDNFHDGKINNYKNIQNNREGEKLVIRCDKKGKCGNDTIIAPYYDFVEHFREKIKAPNGYLKRRKERGE